MSLFSVQWCWINSGGCRPNNLYKSFFFFLDLVAFRLIPVICPAWRAEPENDWNDVIHSREGLSRNRMSNCLEINSWKHCPDLLWFWPRQYCDRIDPCPRVFLTRDHCGTCRLQSGLSALSGNGLGINWVRRILLGSKRLVSGFTCCFVMSFGSSRSLKAFPCWLCLDRSQKGKMEPVNSSAFPSSSGDDTDITLTLPGPWALRQPLGKTAQRYRQIWILSWQVLSCLTLIFMCSNLCGTTDSSPRTLLCIQEREREQGWLRWPSDSQREWGRFARIDLRESMRKKHIFW